MDEKLLKEYRVVAELASYVKSLNQNYNELVGVGGRKVIDAFNAYFTNDFGTAPQPPNNRFFVWGYEFENVLEPIVKSNNRHGHFVTYHIMPFEGWAKKVEVGKIGFDLLGNTPHYDENFPKVVLGRILKYIQDLQDAQFLK
jgi:hypothetical protein